MSADPRRPVVFVIGSAQQGGAESQLVRLAGELAARGTDTRVLFVAGGGPLTQRLDAHHVRWVVCRRVRSRIDTLDLLVSVVLLAYHLTVWRPRVVFAWLSGSMWMGLPLAWALTRARRVASFRGISEEPGLRGRIQRWAVSHAHAVTINAPHLQDEAVLCGAHPRQIIFIPNGVDLPGRAADTAPAPPTGVMVANFKWYKGHDLLLAALRHVQTPLLIRLVGAGDTTEVRTLIADHGLTGRVEIVGQPADVPAELARAQFAVHTARTEGLPNAVLEALSYGLPVVGTDVGGIALLIGHGEGGYVVPLGDEAALARRLDEVASAPELRARMSAVARSRARQYGWDVCTDRYLWLIAELTAAGAA